MVTGVLQGVVTLWLLAADLPRAGEERHDVHFSTAGEVQVTAAACKRHGWRGAVKKLDLEQETFSVIIPENYTSKRRFGVLVYISPGKSGLMLSPRLDRAKLRQLLADQELVYVGANNTGNDRHFFERLQLALVGAQNMLKAYDGNADRVLVAGLSGGGRMSTIAGRFAPEVFTGVAAICGCNYHRPVPAGKGKSYPVDMTLTPDRERRVRQQVRFALISGVNDFNYANTRAVAKAYRAANYQAQLFDVPELGHEIPGPEALAQVFDYLSGKEPPTK